VVLSEGSAGVRTRAALEGRLVGLRDLSNIRLKHTGGLDSSPQSLDPDERTWRKRVGVEFTWSGFSKHL